MRYKIIFLMICFFCNMVALSESTIKDDKDFNNYITFFYYQPNYQEAPDALLYLLGSPLYYDAITKNLNQFKAIAFFFGRIAELHPELLEEYKRIYKSSDRVGQAFILTIFSFYRDAEIETFLKAELTSDPVKNKFIEDILDVPCLGQKGIMHDVEDVVDLDYLWMEIFITGNQEAFQKIVDVLNWKDLFADKVQQWMFEEHSEKDKIAFQNLLKNELRISVDFLNYKIDYITDLDCLFSTYINYSQRRSLITNATRIRYKLKISEQEMVYIATKGAVHWSILTNAHRYPLVLKYCEDEVKKRNDKAAKELGMILRKLQSRKKVKIGL